MIPHSFEGRHFQISARLIFHFFAAFSSTRATTFPFYSLFRDDGCSLVVKKNILNRKCKVLSQYTSHEGSLLCVAKEF